MAVTLIIKASWWWLLYLPVLSFLSGFGVGMGRDLYRKISSKPTRNSHKKQGL